MADTSFVPRGPLGRALGPVAQGPGGNVEDAAALAREADKLRREDGLSLQASLQSVEERLRSLEVAMNPNLRVFARASISVVSGVFNEDGSALHNMAISLSTSLSVVFVSPAQNHTYSVVAMNGSGQTRFYSASVQTVDGFGLTAFSDAGGILAMNTGTYRVDIAVSGN